MKNFAKLLIAASLVAPSAFAQDKTHGGAAKTGEHHQNKQKNRENRQENRQENSPH